jgi:hypothetical protein
VLSKKDHLAGTAGHQVDGVRQHYGINVSDRILASAGHELRNVIRDPSRDRVVRVAAVAIISSFSAKRPLRSGRPRQPSITRTRDQRRAGDFRILKPCSANM